MFVKLIYNVREPNSDVDIAPLIERLSQVPSSPPELLPKISRMTNAMIELLFETERSQFDKVDDSAERNVIYPTPR